MEAMGNTADLLDEEVAADVACGKTLHQLTSSKGLRDVHKSVCHTVY